MSAVSSFATVTVVGVRVTVGVTASTVTMQYEPTGTSTVVSTPSILGYALILAVPTLSPFTTPLGLTVATELLLLTHIILSFVFVVVLFSVFCTTPLRGLVQKTENSCLCGS